MLSSRPRVTSSHAGLRGITHLRATLALVALLAGWAGIAALAQSGATYLYTLSNFDGRLPYDWPRVAVDAERDEIYVVYQDLVRIFNAAGMETFTFGDGLDLGHVIDAAVDDRGDVILLSYRQGQPLVTRCDYRGVPREEIAIRNLPEGWTFGAGRMIHREGLLYFAALNTGRVIVTTTSGEFREAIELLPLLDLGDRRPGDVEIAGFSVDRPGNIYLTVPVLFRAYRLSPDRKLEDFGRPGSAPGRFGVVAGIVADSRGRILVADKLKSVVMLFDRDFTFLAEFGYRGLGRENLIVPSELSIDSRDRVYVTQARKRGVAVFALAGG